ncbi:MAG: preprotein translocase subunit SecA [Patescibacteria group bacterium]|jgi:preprotein translocase subunit SecA
MALIQKIFGDPNKKVLREIQPIIDEINNLEGKIKVLSDEKLKEKIDKFKDELRDKEYEEQQNILNKILPEVFAAGRESMSRRLGQRHFDVQLMGGIVLHRGQIAEMRTGEGKTQTAILPSVLNALTGRGVHVVTPNDYLSQVGGGWTGPVYNALGLSVGVITHDFAGVYDPEYISGEKHGDDERLKHWRPVKRKEAYACDIIYGTNNEYGFDYLRDNMAPDLERMVQRDLHYAIVDEIDSILIDEARTPLIISAPAQESGDKYAQFSRLVTQLKENEDYNIDEKMRAATLTEGGLTKMEKLLGVKNIYTEGGISEVHHIEQALKAYTLFKRDKDYVIKDGEIIIVDEFTGRLMPGRRYSEGLHQAIEAKEGVEVKRESMTVATITFQNYFRMYKKLSGMTGTAKTEEEEFGKIYGLPTVVIPTNKENIRKDMTDLVYGTEQGKFKAIVRDVKERQEKGQPILIGTISIEKNEVLADMLERAGVKAQVLNAKNHEKEAQFIADAGRSGSVTIATNMAGRGVDIILGGGDKEDAKKVKELGGLHVVGTERHESRRIDNQLRGRAGRQGDRGSSQFYLSMEDDLMRIFGGDRMKNIMKTLKVPEDMPIENKIISNSIEKAQKKVEENNFDIRKHLVEYDDVINKHRDAIYRKRREILNREKEGKSYDDFIMEMIAEEVNMVVNFHTAGERSEDWNVKEIYETVRTIFAVPDDLEEKLKVLKDRQQIIDYIIKLSEKAYSELEKSINSLGGDDDEQDISFKNIQRQILIRSIDTLWTEHIDAMDQMRRGIGLRGYGQRDPLVEYKKESYSLFQQLNDLIRKQVVYSIFKVGDVTQFISPDLLQRARQFSAFDKSAGSFSGFKKDGNSAPNTPPAGLNFAQQKVKDEDGNKVGRNDPCPCGAVKPDGTPVKYKHCHGK